MANYLTNKELIRAFKESRDLDNPTPELWRFWELIIKGVFSKRFFVDSNDREDCTQNVRLVLARHWRSYKPEKGGNAFAYFTSAVMNGCTKGMQEIRPRLMEKQPDGRWVYGKTVKFISTDDCYNI